MKNIAAQQNQKGFTIIETMIAISIFLIVVIVGMGTLLNASVVGQKAQDQRAILDGLSFVMDDISRSLRTGYNFYCPSNSSTVSDCNNSDSIKFTNQYGQTIIYRVNTTNQGRGRLQKNIDGTGFITITTSDIDLDTISGFSVAGAPPPPGDTRQPFILVRMSGEITTKEGYITPFSVQTSVSQRQIDI